MAINRDKVEAAAIKLLQQGKYDKAIAELKKLVEDDPTDVRTLLKLGDTHVKMGNKKESIDSYERAAAIYTEQGFFLKAVAVYKQILRVDANVPELHLKLAELYQQLGLTSDALQHYHNVAVFHENGGRPREALEMLKRMVDLDPDNLASRIKLGELFAQQGLAAEATTELRSALGFLKTQQRFDDYVRVGEKLVQYDPSALDVARDLAQIYMQRNQPSVALSKLQMCFKAEPRNVDILALIAQAFLDMQQVPKTISVFKEMAKIYAADGKVDLAQRTWERVLEHAPHDPEAEAALGRAPATAVAPNPMGRPTAVPTVVAPAQAGVAAVPPAATGARAPSAEEEALQRLLTETDVYVKYGLKEKAVEHLQKVFALKPDHIPALEKARTLQMAVGSPDLKDTLRKLVKAAEKQGHARVDEWRGELLRLESKPARPVQPAVPAPSARLPSVEGDVIVVDDRPPEELPDEPFLADDPSASTIQLEGDESGIMQLDAVSELDEPFESGLDSLPPDEDEVGAVPSALPGAPRPSPSQVRADIPRMPTGVMSAPRAAPAAAPAPAPVAARVAPAPAPIAARPAPAPTPMHSSHSSPLSSPLSSPHSSSMGATIARAPLPAPAMQPLELSEEIVDADALVRQALQDISEGDMLAAADDLLSGEGASLLDDAIDEGFDAVAPDAAAGVPRTGTLQRTGPLPANVPGDAPLPAVTASTRALNSSANTMTMPTQPVVGSDEEIDRLAREAVADASRSLGMNPEVASTALMGLTDAELNEIRDFEGDTAAPAAASASKQTAMAAAFAKGTAAPSQPSQPPLPPEFSSKDDEGMGFDDPTLAQSSSSSNEVTDERPNKGSGVEPVLRPHAPHPATQPSVQMPPSSRASSQPNQSAFMSLGDDEDVKTVFTRPEDVARAMAAPAGSARATGAPASGFEGDVSEEFDPSSFDLPPDVKEMLRAGKADADALSPDTFDAVSAREPAPAEITEPAPAMDKAQALGVADKAHGFEDDPANQFFPDELEEAEFFIKNELLDEAREILNAIMEDVPDSGRVQWMMARVEAKENGQPEPPAPWETKLEEQILEEVQAHLDDLGIQDAPDTTAQVSVEEVLSQFKKGVAEMVPEDDAATHYELGIAYREMGLVDDAISEFQIASRAQSRAVDARYVIGLVKMDQGKFEEAVKAFDEALSNATATKDQRGAAEYSKGASLEELGRQVEALRSFKAAKLFGNGAVDIDRRIKALVDKVGDVDVGAGGANGTHGASGANGHGTATKGPPGRGPKNIDYL